MIKKAGGGGRLLKCKRQFETLGQDWSQSLRYVVEKNEEEGRERETKYRVILDCLQALTPKLKK